MPYWRPQEDGTWQWVEGEPPQWLLFDWSYASLTDASASPHGYWRPVHGGGWQWIEGGNPPDNLLRNWSREQLTNPAQTPHGADNSRYEGGVGLDDVTPPTLTQVWFAAPTLPGEFVFFTPPAADTPPPTTIPDVANFAVTPNDLRDAQGKVLGESATQVTAYMGLRQQVIDSYGFNWGGDGRDAYNIRATQNNSLLLIASAIHQAGIYVGMLNDAAQFYVQADEESLPPTGT